MMDEYDDPLLKGSLFQVSFSGRIRLLLVWIDGFISTSLKTEDHRDEP